MCYRIDPLSCGPSQRNLNFFVREEEDSLRPVMGSLVLNMQNNTPPQPNNRRIFSNLSFFPDNVAQIILQYAFDPYLDEYFSEKEMDVIIPREENALRRILNKSIILAKQGGRHAWNYISYLILSLRADITSRYPTGSKEMVDAAKQNNLRMLIEAMKKRKKILIRGNPLQWMAIFVDFEALNILLEKRLDKDGKRYDINNTDFHFGRTPLHSASMYENKSFAEKIMFSYLNHLGDENIKDTNGFTPRQYQLIKNQEKSESKESKA